MSLLFMKFTRQISLDKCHLQFLSDTVTLALWQGRKGVQMTDRSLSKGNNRLTE